MQKGNSDIQEMGEEEADIEKPWSRTAYLRLALGMWGMVVVGMFMVSAFALTHLIHPDRSAIGRGYETDLSLAGFIVVFGLASALGMVLIVWVMTWGLRRTEIPGIRYSVHAMRFLVIPMAFGLVGTLVWAAYQTEAGYFFIDWSQRLTEGDRMVPPNFYDIIGIPLFLMTLIAFVFFLKSKLETPMLVWPFLVLAVCFLVFWVAVFVENNALRSEWVYLRGLSHVKVFWYEALGWPGWGMGAILLVSWISIGVEVFKIWLHWEDRAAEKALDYTT